MELNAPNILDVLQNSTDMERYRNELGLDIEGVWRTLLEEEVVLQGLMPWSSNYTFLVNVGPPEQEEEGLLAIYKPCQGERPLWDFPDGALCWREFATYLVSEVLGWPRIPPTVLRADGPHGAGTVQLFIEAEYEAHYFNMRHIGALAEDFRRIALFDLIVNNADRKGGHCLKDKQGQIWAIDHGLTFHADYKLRTVIWEFCEDAIAPRLLKDLERLRRCLTQPTPFNSVMSHLLTATEIEALKERIDILLVNKRFPNMGRGRNVPYPPI